MQQIDGNGTAAKEKSENNETDQTVKTGSTPTPHHDADLVSHLH